MAGCFWWELETSYRTDRLAQMSSVCKLFVQQVGLPWRSDPGLQPATVLWHANHRQQLLKLQDVSLGAWGCTQSQVWNKKHDNSRWSKCDVSEVFWFLQIKHPFCNMYVPRKSKVGRWRCRCNGVSKCDAFARQGMKALIWFTQRPRQCRWWQICRWSSSKLVRLSMALDGTPRPTEDRSLLTGTLMINFDWSSICSH